MMKRSTSFKERRKIEKKLLSILKEYPLTLLCILLSSTSIIITSFQKENIKLQIIFVIILLIFVTILTILLFIETKRILLKRKNRDNTIILLFIAIIYWLIIIFIR